MIQCLVIRPQIEVEVQKILSRMQWRDVMVVCGNDGPMADGAPSAIPRLRLRVFRGDGEPGDPSYDVELDLDPEQDEKNDDKQAKACGRRFKERLEVGFGAFDVTIAGGQAILGLIRCGGDGIPYVLQEMMRTTLRAGVTYGMQEGCLGNPEFKTPLLVVQRSQSDKQPLFIDVDGKTTPFLISEGGCHFLVDGNDRNPLLQRLRLSRKSLMLQLRRRERRKPGRRS